MTRFDGTPSEQALAEFFSQHRSRLWRMVNFRLDHRLQGRVDPDDILQEAYLNAASKLKHYNGDSATSLYVWLRMIVNQTIIDVYRRHLGAQKRNVGRELPNHAGEIAPTTTQSLTVQLMGNFTSPTQAAVQQETFAEVEKAIERLDPIDREVLALRHFEDLSNSEAASVLGIKQKAASIRYVRAVTRLKQVLSQIPGYQAED